MCNYNPRVPNPAIIIEEYPVIMALNETLSADLKEAISSGSDLSEALSSILSYASESHENQVFLGHDQGLVSILLECLSKPPYEQNHDVCDLIFTALIRLCRRTMSKETACVMNCDLVLRDRGGKRILDSLANFILEKNHIIGTACHLIMVLAADSSERQCLLAEEGVSVALAAVLFQYSSDDYAAEMGARAVRNLATNDDVAGALISEGIAEALVKVLNENKSPIVLEQCLWATVNLSCNGHIATILGSAGVLDVIVKIMDQHCSDALLVEAAASAMRNLLSDSEMNMSQIVKCKDSMPTASILIRCLSIHQENQSVCEVLLWACANLASCNELGNLLYDDGIMPIILSNYHQASITRNYDLKEAVTWTLRNIINSVPQHVDAIIRNEIVNEVIETIIRADDQQDSLRYISLDVLRSLLSHAVLGSAVTDAIIESFVNPVLATMAPVTPSSSMQAVHTCLRIASSMVPLEKSSIAVHRFIEEMKLLIDSEVMLSLSAQHDKIQTELAVFKDLLN
jgi:hypothetical protein